MIVIKILVTILLLALAVLIIVEKWKMIEKSKIQQDVDEDDENYEVPQLKELTEEQIADIHARGKITPAEKLKEWEGAGLCAPGDAIGGAAWRCHKFRNCHDCLVDYANTQNEYTSFYDEIKIIHK